ncbi:MAG: PCRF domain-containing protein [Phycisphaerales bacterium]|nr:PCRF domain-containing protein [Phycisphaerales bacterium]
MTDLQHKLRLRMETLAVRLTELESRLGDPATAADPHRLRDVSVEQATLAPMVAQYRLWLDLENQITAHQALITDNREQDLIALAREELPDLQQQVNAIVDSLTRDLVTAEDRAVGSVILEIRAGTGGDEAGLWAGDLFSMYERFAGDKKWEFTLLDVSPGDMGGIRNVTVHVAGPGVWQGLGYEGGVHCVKRVPATETQGRIHTSTATVAVLPEPEKVQIDIPDSDVKMDITTAQGPGGQNVNKVATAVKMVHIPTGIEVRMQESKSQQQNRQRAWQLLRARVFDHYQRLKDAQRAADRSRMIGTGDRIAANSHLSVQGIDCRGSPPRTYELQVAGSAGWPTGCIAQ